MVQIDEGYTNTQAGVGQPGAAKVSEQYRERAGLPPLEEGE